MKIANIGIIGGGIAGNALAQFLALQNIEVTILEKIAIPKPIGSGIMLQKPALVILEKLGLREQIEKNGQKINGFFGQNKEGKTVIDFDFVDFNESLYGMGVHRGSIFSNLTQKSLDNPKINLLFGKEVNKIENLSNSVKVSTVEGEVFSFELVVVANGSASLLRNQFPSIVKKAEMQKYAALWTTLPYQEGEYSHQISHIYHKSQYMFGLMPIGYATNEHKGEPQINFFCAITQDFYKKWDRNKFGDWKKFSETIAPQYSQFFDQIQDFDQLVATPYFDAKLRPFYKERVAFIGDACHALSPHLSAGTNLALMDAYVLSETIKVSKTHTEAFEKYYEERKKQIQFYYFISKIITPMFQSKVNLGWMRDTFVPIMYKFGWTKHFMVETISGIRKGIFSKMDEEFYVD